MYQTVWYKPGMRHPKNISQIQRIQAKTNGDSSATDLEGKHTQFSEFFSYSTSCSMDENDFSKTELNPKNNSRKRRNSHSLNFVSVRLSTSIYIYDHMGGSVSVVWERTHIEQKLGIRVCILNIHTEIRRAKEDTTLKLRKLYFAVCCLV